VFVDVGVLWEHHIDQSLVHAVLDYQILQRSVKELPISLPLGCHLENIELIAGTNSAALDVGKPSHTSSIMPWSPHIKNWQIDTSNKQPRLTVELQRPISGVFHLLLELRFDRHRLVADNLVIPISAPRPIDATSYRGFVAYLLDGVKGELTQKMPRAVSGSIDFARPWLPALLSVPGEQILPLTPEDSPTTALHLRSLTRDYRVNGACDMFVGDREVISTLKLQLQPEETPLLHLIADLPAGQRVTEVQGQRLARWQVIPSTSHQPEKLEIWLRGPLAVGETGELKLTSRAPLSIQPNAAMTVDLLQPRWNTGRQEPITLTLKKSAQVDLDNLHFSEGVTKLYSPWQDQSIASQCLLDPATAKKTVTFQPRFTAQQLVTHAEVVETSTGPEWHLKLQAFEGQSLPPALEVVSTTEQSLSRMTFQADVPVASRPFIGQDQKLHWSIQASAPCKQLTISKHLTLNESGQLKLPALFFPQFPQLKYVQPDGR
jgi:hypothetical protein